MKCASPVSCPSCNTLNSEDEKEIVKGLIKRAEVKDVDAMALLGTKYAEGTVVPQSMHKAIEIWEEAAELGGIRACYTLGEIYKPGSAKGVLKTGRKLSSTMQRQQREDMIWQGMPSGCWGIIIRSKR